MGPTGGWNIWAMDGAKLRQFTVGEPDEAEAFNVLKAAHPTVQIVSGHTMDTQIIGKLGVSGGKVCEWVPLDPKQELTNPGGQPIDKPMWGKNA